MACYHSFGKAGTTKCDADGAIKRSHHAGLRKKATRGARNGAFQTVGRTLRSTSAKNSEYFLATILQLYFDAAKATPRAVLPAGECMAFVSASTRSCCKLVSTRYA